LILHETEIKGKRYVIGSVNKQISTDIREWISFTDDIIMKQTLKALTEENLLPATKNPGDFDRRAMAIWKHVAQKFKYVHDTAKQRKEDFWLFPPEILTLGKGDCEDSSFLLASLLTASGISPFCVRVVLGEVFDEKGKSLGGHCYPIYKNELGDWCILESTLDKIPSRMSEADSLSAPNQFFQ
jgi:predicted transglutaminase-like cysteine proteinase